MQQNSTTPPMRQNLVVLFGYDSSVFTQKVRLALRLKQIPYTFVLVPSMMPRPILKDNFNVGYRKIPVLAIDRELYIDTSLILEALEHQFPPSAGYPTLYPGTSAGQSLRPFIRGFASYWTDRPLFRVTTGLIPSSVWRTSFGKDRASLIGHQLDPDKLERKIPVNLSGLDLHLSLLEPMLESSSPDTSGLWPGQRRSPWLLDTPTPSAADIALFYQLDWGDKISRGAGIYDLTGGGTQDDGGDDGVSLVLNRARYPRLTQWFETLKQHFASLPDLETRIEREDERGVEDLMQRLQACSQGPRLDHGNRNEGSDEAERPIPMIPTPARPHTVLDARNGLVPGVLVSVAPDDTGRNDPTSGTLLALSPEEVVIAPTDIVNDEQGQAGRPREARVKVRVHFPRIGFVARPLARSPLKL